MIRMTTVHMTIGMKSNLRRELVKKLQKETNGFVISMDILKQEYAKDKNPKKYLDKTNQMLKEEIKKGTEHVILDGSNLSRRGRIHIIQHECKNCEVVAHYVNVSLTKYLVEEEYAAEPRDFKSIQTMYGMTQPPFSFEGYSSIQYHYGDQFVNARETNKEELMQKALMKWKNNVETFITSEHSYEKFKNINQISPLMDSIWELPSDTSSHMFSASRFVYYVHQQLLKEMGEEKDLALLYASIFQYIGRGLTKTFTNMKGEPSVYANYLGSENIAGSQAIERLMWMGYSQEFAEEVALLSHMHIYLANGENPKVKEWLSAEQYEKFETLRRVNKMFQTQKTTV